jgi:hypothetical protein
MHTRLDRDQVKDSNQRACMKWSLAQIPREAYSREVVPMAERRWTAEGGRDCDWQGLVRSESAPLAAPRQLRTVIAGRVTVPMLMAEGWPDPTALA